MSDFDTQPLLHLKTSYRPQNALWMAKIARAVYTKKSAEDEAPDEQRLVEMLQKDDPKFQAATGFNVKSSQGCVIVHEEYIVAAFRGTDEAADWLDNINVLPMAGPFGAVHSGFHNALMDIWPAMKREIRRVRRASPKPLPLWLTGHSLGAAMATLAAAQLIKADEPFFGLYTYGSPRCGDRDFARIYNVEAGKRTFRFQNNNDIVTRVPARMMGYSHVGQFIYISKDQELSTDVGFWYQFLDSLSGVINDIGTKGFDSISDHSMNDYIAAIRTWGERPPED